MMRMSGEAMIKRNTVMAPGMISALEKRGYDAYFCATMEELQRKVLELIPAGESVAWGGSLSLKEAGIPDLVRENGYKLLDRDAAKTPEERQALMRQALLCHTYLSSVNAMTEDGMMVNIDGNCNRIAAIAFGPESVILIVGMNKICRDLPAARHRAQCFAAPANGIRLGVELPCTKTGFCRDCQAENSMCAQIVEMRRNRIPHRIKVLLTPFDLGL